MILPRNYLEKKGKLTVISLAGYEECFKVFDV